MSQLLKTEQFAQSVGRAPQTIRALHCATGEAFGVKPIKIGRLLMWPADQVDALLSGNAQTETQQTK